jgi:hypothetical protein
MRSLVTFGFAALGLTALLGCGETAAPADNTFTDAQRAEIEAEIEQLMTELYDAAKEANIEPMLARQHADPGICLWGTNIYDCQQVFDNYREAWSRDEGRRLERQEMDGEEIRVMAISPTVAIGVHTSEENRAIYTDGQVSRARFASFSVFVLEEGVWKIHSGQQASWPIEEGGEG